MQRGEEKGREGERGKVIREDGGRNQVAREKRRK